MEKKKVLQLEHVCSTWYSKTLCAILLNKGGQCFFCLVRITASHQSTAPAVITCTYDHEIEASGLRASAPQADQLMDRKGH